ncbi:hypothetical protein SAMN05444005_101218 [Flavobacterium urocaniciphilum]|uniref:Uncharacterized protein n=1 Tax=Flavobacterium urocaniciphilum TaxID=1299341 RepID=A0A1H8YTQ8_9FLAO|nr:hypothetical protein SAMN05444005_101218 [Flavobacterium urocaniciphilum]
MKDFINYFILALNPIAWIYYPCQTKIKKNPKLLIGIWDFLYFEIT